MLSLLYQFQIVLTPFMTTLLLILFPALLVLIGAIMLKVGLRIVEAETRISFKWALISLGIQIGVIIFIISPILFMGLGTGFGNMNLGLLPPIAITAIFMDFNLINMIHRLGMRKTITVFLLTMIPIVVFGGLTGLIAALVFF